MGKALDYAYKLWPRLQRYALDGRYNIDNNPVERNQRPSVIGRKNYLFSKSNSGALDNAIFYSLIEMRYSRHQSITMAHVCTTKSS